MSYVGAYSIKYLFLRKEPSSRPRLAGGSAPGLYRAEAGRGLCPWPLRGRGWPGALPLASSRVCRGRGLLFRDLLRDRPPSSSCVFAEHRNTKGSLTRQTPRIFQIKKTELM